MTSILLVDDDRDFADAVSLDLRGAGHQVNVVHDGEAAISLQQRPGSSAAVDLYIIDILMPNRDGIDTIMKLRKAGVNAPMIAITGGGQIKATELLRYAGKLGTTATLAKPFASQDLLDLVGRLAP